MRALGIPNNKNFYEVTSIAEAQALWANIQASASPRLRSLQPVYHDQRQIGHCDN